jgi:uncharacterized protein
VRTDIAAFLGFAERGPVARLPQDQTIAATTAVLRLTSWKEYEAAYGYLTTVGYLPYAVKAFFANSGSTCYVARIATNNAKPAFYSVPGTPAATVVTSLSAPAAAGQNQVSVEAAGVLAAGSTIIFTSGPEPEFTRVSHIPDSKTAVLAQTLRFHHRAGAPVRKTAHIAAASLARNITGGSNRIEIDDCSGFAANSMVRIGGRGHTEMGSVASVDPVASALTLSVPVQFDHFAGDTVAAEDTAFRVEAMSPGTWGNSIWIQILPLDAGAVSLRVTLDPRMGSTATQQQEFYPRINWTDIADQVNSESHLIRVTAGGQGPMPSFTSSTVIQRLSGGDDGLDDSLKTSDFTGSTGDRCGLRLLEEIAEIGIVCTPDAVYAPVVRKVAPLPPVPPCSKPAAPAAPTPVISLPAPQFTEIYPALLDHCAKMRYRVAVLDAPDGFRLAQAQTLWMNGLMSKPSAPFGALYHPWIKIVDPLGSDGSMLRFPPSGHVAGLYAYTDQNSGTQKPPANGVALTYADDLGESLTDLQQGLLNDAQVNVIRALAGRGIRVWGARSLSMTPQWRFIHTRRLLSMIEDSVEKSTQWTVFEPNDANLRRTLTHALTVFLEGIWSKGGLQGDRPEYGFFVKCDNTNNPQPTIAAGQLICQVGVAIAAPMEFLVFEIRRLIEGADLVEI